MIMPWHVANFCVIISSTVRFLSLGNVSVTVTVSLCCPMMRSVGVVLVIWVINVLLTRMSKHVMTSPIRNLVEWMAVVLVSMVVIG